MNFDNPSGPPRHGAHPSGALQGSNPGLGDDFFVSAPSVELPRGGGAIRGIGETFTANPVTGTASMSIPLALSPGRGGFGPGVALSYDSGGGNGPFGLGWRLDAPSIRRKTDKGLPRYRDGLAAGAADSDLFQLAGAEDLVPMLEDVAGVWTPVERVDGSSRVRRYRPRVEAGFAKIERWFDTITGDVHWRVHSGDNLVRLYGLSPGARLADPNDARRVFQWFLEEVRDDRGNVIWFTYKSEDRVGVDVSNPAESARAVDDCSYTFLKRIRYGNRTPHVASANFATEAWAFEAVFDYGEHTANTPAEVSVWPERQDPHSSFRPGFDMRCYRLCRRVLMFHRFDLGADPDTLGAAPVLVRETAITYEESPAVTRLVSAVHTGHRAGLPSLSSPPVAFTYTNAVIGQSVAFVQGLEDLRGVDFRTFRWIDLDGEGLSGLLTERAGAWFYKPNDGQGQLGPVRRLPTQPSQALSADGARLLDLNGDGRVDLVSTRGALKGSWSRDAGVVGRPETGTWESFRPFRSVPNVDFNDPNVRMFDIDGDGLADLVISEDRVFTWYKSKGRDGYEAPQWARKGHDEDKGPTLVFASEADALFLADMTGDGLTDLVRIRRGSICYWPNKGHGRFGAKVWMSGPPWFDHRSRFDPARIRLADVDGTGPTDLVYVGPDSVRLWFNQSGNSWSGETVVRGLGGVDNAASVQVTDLLGEGTACLVWSSPLFGAKASPLRYLRLMAEGKPHLMRSTKNNLGRETTFSYTPSTRFYVADRKAGTPWATRLPFVVQCLSKVDVVDHITGWRFTQRFAYHHGVYDGPEREFRGFGKVETWDTESYPLDGANQDDRHHVPPVRTVTWFHTGAYKAQQSLTAAYEREYWSGDLGESVLPAIGFAAGLATTELIEAHRALKGQVLRSEVYAEDGTAEAGVPYTVSQATFEVRRLQPHGEAPYACFHVVPGASLTAQVERDAADPRAAVSVPLEIDAFGAVKRAAVVSEARAVADLVAPEQGVRHVVLSRSEVTHVDQIDRYHLAVAYESETLELTGFTGTATRANLDAAWTAATPIAHQAVADPVTNGLEVRPLTRQRTTYWNDTRTGALALGSVGAVRIPYESLALAFDDAQLLAALGATRTPNSTALLAAGYVLEDGAWWVRSGRIGTFTASFLLPLTSLDAFGTTTATVVWDADLLFPLTVTDAVGNTVTARVDRITLSPWRITDPNDGVQEVAFDALGRVTKTAVRTGDSDTAPTEGDTLAEPSTELTYHHLDYVTSGTPAKVFVRSRETHHRIGGVTQPAPRWQEATTYTDGGGNAVVTKVRAEEDPAFPGVDRWVGNGRTVLDNKGNPVKQYEPYFSGTVAFDPEEGFGGVTPVLHYDPVGRLVRTDLPDGTYTKVVFDAWRQESWDASDTVLDSDWYTARLLLSAGDPDRLAAEASALHANTPSVTVLDALGRPVLTRAHHSFVEEPASSGTFVPLYFDTRVVLDVQGNARQVIDARGVVVHDATFDRLGRPLFVHSPDAGDTWAWAAVDSQPVHTFKSGETSDLQLVPTYDALRRRTRLTVTDEGTVFVAEAIEYGNATGAPAASRLKGRVWRTWDTAGRVELTYDFKGNPIRSERLVLTSATATVDWTTPLSATPLNTTEVFGTETDFDALNRPTETRSPGPDGPDATAEQAMTYNQRGGLETVSAAHRPSVTPLALLITGIDYDERGQRTLVTRSNTVKTAYFYDALTFRLTQLKSTRTTPTVNTLQDLTYTYDAVGNITRKEDAAQQTVFFSNTMTTPTETYTYDALHRLVEGTGRETTNTWTDGTDVPWYTPVAMPTGAATTAMRPYTETYVYDEVGNFETLTHTAGAGSFTRSYVTEAASNRLTSTTRAGVLGSYTHSARGAMTAMPHLPTMDRDFRDELAHCVNPTATVEAWYRYDGGGQRVRRSVSKNGSLHPEERVYIGPSEVFRRFDSSGVLVHERWSLWVSDGVTRVAVLDAPGSVTDGIGLTTDETRWQLQDHLGSGTIETDGSGNVISAEAYHPYGSTAWRSGRSEREVKSRRFRYTGKERDEETGLQDHGARRYAVWLGRWDGADPAGFVDGTNRFAYVSANPVRLVDPTGQAEVEGAHDPRGRRDTSADPLFNQPTRLEKQARLHGQVTAQIRTLEIRYTRADAALRSLSPPRPHETGDEPRGVSLTLAFRLAFTSDIGATLTSEMEVAIADLRALGDEGLAERRGGRYRSTIRDQVVASGATDDDLVKFDDWAANAEWWGGLPERAERASLLTGLSGGGGPAMVMAKGPKGPLIGEGVRRASKGGLFANKFPSHAVGNPIQTFTAQQAGRSSFSRKLNYVVTESGELRLGRISNEVGGGHIDLAGGAAVQAAGEVKIVGGQIRMIDNSSGHYLPSGAGAQAATETAFQNAGFSTAGTYVEKVWSGSAWVAK